MKSNFQKSVYDMLGGEVSEQNNLLDRIEELEQESIKKKVKLTMKPQESNELYHNIKAAMRGGDEDQVAMEIVAKIQRYLEEKEKEAYGTVGPKGPVFRRSES
jgi:hypothetical protein